jgi:hypothetical protein
MERMLVSLLLGVAVALSAVAGSTAAPARSSRTDALLAPCNETGATTGDWEVSFGVRVIRRKALLLVSQVHRKGFRRAIIEREQCLYEVSVIHLTLARAQTLAGRARRKRLRVLVVRS